MLMLEPPHPRSAEVLGTHGSMLATVRVPAQDRADSSSARTESVELVAREVDLDTCAIYVDGRMRGWIHRDGHAYVALAGTVPEKAKDCGHSLLWDEAAALLLAAAAGDRATGGRE
ncbi:hypothetical protein [Gryllotalpicola ginsengisoli]|uniref:hypothetical protein n=1 Tax=Gryllotalpicola ginsengisoli TaxID=444608 RepID=UPI0003B31372|nr:hypothetical protein [Gryllotalpicola ginsengisoli]